ncbi:MAG: histidine triad nucleotide-binding protein [Oscillospiraceae bacterium]|jgi:histidine triad (HIT) family protein|nr:histidine triad nucleotide-binding protein [Oscillospiraceae bacterium]
MDGCLFCKIINGEISSEKVYEDGEMVALRDIAPQAPVHLLIIPKRHISGADGLRESDAALAGAILLTAKRLAEENSLENGWRVVTNVGEDGGQTVGHLHFHLLGGAKLGGFGGCVEGRG